MTQAVEILVTKTRDGRYRARMRWGSRRGIYVDGPSIGGMAVRMVRVLANVMMGEKP